MRVALALALIAIPTLAQAEFRQSTDAEIAYWSGRVADTPAKCSEKMRVWAHTSKLRLMPEDCEYGPKAIATKQEVSPEPVRQASPDEAIAYMRRLEKRSQARHDDIMKSARAAREENRRQWEDFEDAQAERARRARNDAPSSYSVIDSSTGDVHFIQRIN